MKIKINPYILFLSVVWILYECCFYLVKLSVGSVLVYDIANILLFFFFVYVSVKYNMVHPKRWNIYNYLVVFIILCILISSLTAKIHWNQSFITTVLPQRHLIVIFLTYFSVDRLVRLKKINVDQIYNLLISLGKIYLVILMIQFVCSKFNYYFLTCDINLPNQIYSTARYSIDGVLPLLVLFHYVDSFMNKKININTIVWIVFALIFFFLMYQTRMALLGIILSISIYYLLWNTNIKKKTFFVFVMISAMFFVWNSDLFQSMINIGNSSSRNTLDIRQNGIIFYLTELKKSFIFGMGFPNSDLADLLRGRTLYNYMLNDNGVFGFAYMYGLTGIIWVCIMYFCCLKKSYKLKKYSDNKVLFMYIVYMIVVSASLIHWYWIRSTALVLVLIWIILQHKKIEILNKDTYTNIINKKRSSF